MSSQENPKKVQPGSQGLLTYKIRWFVEMLLFSSEKEWQRPGSSAI